MLLNDIPSAVMYGSSSNFAGRLRVDGRMMRNDKGYFRPLFCSMLAILTKDDWSVLDYVAGAGFNGIRVFCGALSWAGQTPQMVYDRLPKLLQKCKDLGLYVEVSAITDSGVVDYPIAGHIANLAAVIQPFDNVIFEMANEPFHPSQSARVHDPVYLASLMPLVGNVPIALGASADDESAEFAGGSYVTIHLDRGRDKWNQARRVREMENVSATTGKFVMNNEPIGADEKMGGESGTQQRRNDKDFFYCVGVLSRLFEVGGIFHSTAGLNGVPLGPQQQVCADMFVAGFNQIQADDRLAFYNAGWAGSPVASAAFDQTVVRAYTGVAGDKAWMVLVGVTGDPGVKLQGGWSIKDQIANVGSADGSVQVFTLVK